MQAAAHIIRRLPVPHTHLYSSWYIPSVSSKTRLVDRLKHMQNGHKMHRKVNVPVLSTAQQRFWFSHIRVFTRMKLISLKLMFSCDMLLGTARWLWVHISWRNINKQLSNYSNDDAQIHRNTANIGSIDTDTLHRIHTQTHWHTACNHHIHCSIAKPYNTAVDLQATRWHKNNRFISHVACVYDETKQTAIL